MDIKKAHQRIALAARLALLAGAIATSAGCRPVISPYDVNLDNGLSDFKQKINVLVFDAAAHAGTADGSFDKYRPRYAGLETQLSLLRDRAALIEAEDKSCEPSGVLLHLFQRWPSLAQQANAAPATPLATSNDVPVTETSTGTKSGPDSARGCMTRLIDNVNAQLTLLESIHADAKQCDNAEQPKLTCFRPAAAKGALGPLNRSLDAALLVEFAKMKAKE
jgi:hypothetical protein